MLNPNFLLAHRNRYLEGTDDGQKTTRGHPNFNSYIKNLRVLIFITAGWTETLIHGGFPHYVPPGKNTPAFIGLHVGTHNANSNIFSTRVFSIAPITPANIMPQNIIKMFAHFLFLTILHSPNSDCTCLPSIPDNTFVIQCQHLGPLFLTTTQVDCPFARLC